MDIAEFKNDFVVVLEEEGAVAIVQISKRKVILEKKTTCQRASRLFHCKNAVCLVDEAQTVFFYSLENFLLENFLTERIFEIVHVELEVDRIVRVTEILD